MSDGIEISCLIKSDDTVDNIRQLILSSFRFIMLYYNNKKYNKTAIYF